MGLDTGAPSIPFQAAARQPGAVWRGDRAQRRDLRLREAPLDSGRAQLGRFGRAGPARLVPDRHQELVFRIHRYPVTAADGDRSIRPAEIHGDLSQLPVQSLIDFLEGGEAIDDAAKKTGVPISCFYVAVERAWILNSWDQMMIPKPFSQAAVYASGPIYVSADATDEQMSALHQKMQETLERCRLGAEKAFSSQQSAFS